MADRTHMHITIGGTLPRSRIDELVGLATLYQCSAEWDGEPFSETDITPGKALNLYAMEIPGGLAEDLEAFCRENSLPYSRWSGACWGAFNAEIEYYAGKGDAENFASDDDARPMMLVSELLKMTSIEELQSAIAPATLTTPPLELI